ncbi:MAG TPA: MBL fold metallo-hydrolase [Flavobacterium sp.]|nr:MBL fold metallo-hydrolase [Flavobacterium sp.]
MIIDQIYTGCLAQGAYYIESEGEAVVIDPLREVQPYLDKAQKNGAQIKYVFETHFHADFVSGHLDLSKKTGAPIVYGPTANPGFDAHIAKDNEVFKVGKITITAMHTPGHTMESTCYLLKDENGKSKAIFTGDTLFIGDVGRPDLAQKVSAELTQEILAAHLYNSLREKIMPLADDIIVYPAHGAGSACGKNMSKETFDTLGNQKKTNYALQEMTQEAFVTEVLDGLLPPPSYFPENVMMNIKGYESFDVVMDRGLQALTPDAFEEVANTTGALLLDTRNARDFAAGFVPNAINIGIDGGFAPWVGCLILDIKQPILLIADKAREQEVITRLSRVGYDNVVGYLDGGFAAWEQSGKEIDHVKCISAKEFEEINKDASCKVIDIRKEGEFSAEHLENAQSLPLAYINDWMDSIDDTEHFYIHCAGGYRSMIAASILNSRGIRQFTEIGDGFSGLANTCLPKTAFVCPSTTK